MMKAPEAKINALKEHNAKKKQETADRVNKAIDKLKKNNATINFETVAKAADVSRATLYNNPILKERIMGLRAFVLESSIEEQTEPPKTRVQQLEDTVVSLKARVRQLEADKRNLILQLVDYEETKMDNQRLRRQFLKGDLNEK